MKTRRGMCVYILMALLAALAVLLLAAALSAQDAGARNVTGEWLGTIGNQHLLVKIQQAADGSFTGTLTAVDQGNVTLPLDAVSFAAPGTFKFEIKRAGAVYEGQLSDDGNALVGKWSQGGNSLPLTFHHPGAAAAKFTLKPRTQGSVALEPCRSSDGNTEGLCGKYEVFENRTSQSGRKIALNIMVLPALAEKPAPDPWFPLAGGPGQSAVEAFPQAGFTAKVRQQRDVILIDQRGTGKSNPLECVLQSPGNAQALLGEPFPSDKIRDCRAESDKRADTTQYTTTVFAGDLDEVRQAMGYDKINVFGGSYGTKAALVYLRLYGDHVRTLALEAVASPQFLIPLPFAKGLESSIDGVIAVCAADAACRKDYPDFGSEFTTLLDGLGKSPAKFEINKQSVTLTREMFLSKLRSLLYVPPFVSALPAIVHRAHEGDWTPYAATVLGLVSTIEGSVARGASFAAICAEDVPALNDALVRRETRGTYLGDSQVRRYKAYCEAWGSHGAIPRDFYAPVRSKVPALLISGALDPGTPPATAQQVAHDLVNSRLVTVKQGTHGTGSPCIDGLIADFIAQGTAANLNASCADQIHLPSFRQAQ